MADVTSQKRKRQNKSARFSVTPLEWNVPFDAHAFRDTLGSLRPSGISGAYAFKWDYLLDNVLSKYTSPDPNAFRDRETAAYEKFFLMEQRCRSFNTSGFTPFLAPILYRASQIVSSILGPLNIAACCHASRFSGGASTSRSRRLGNPFYKYRTSDPVHVTPRAWKYAYSTISCTPRWAAEGGLHNIAVVPGNQLFTVPKNDEIERVAAKEPDLNMALQLGAGSLIRKSLRKHGIDLNDQSINRRLARLGSITGALATLDLSSASDLISWRLVMELLPPDWFNFLDDIRSQGGYHKGRFYLWEKFSSMGNGFTFELESLLFYALVRATMEQEGLDPVPQENISVYGDDIIIPAECYHSAVSTLELCGLRVNPDKSFATGPFRESCGGHYYLGTDVTPFYIRKPITRPEYLIQVLNRLRLWAYDEDIGVCDSVVYPLWRKLYKSHSLLRRVAGGRDVESIASVVSPARGKFAIEFWSKTRLIATAPAYLCWLQATSERQRLFDPVVSSLIAIPPDGDGPSSIGVKPVEELWTPCPYLFSEEIKG